MNRIIRTTAAAACLAVLLTALAHAQTRPADAPNEIIQVRVEGNRFMSQSAILTNVKIRPGQPYNEQLVREDEQRLLKTRRFDDVTATVTRTDKGVILTFLVRERPQVEALRFEGAKKFNENDLRQALTFGVGDPVDRFQIESGLRAIESKYRAEGYYFVEVKLDDAALGGKNQVVYKIAEGPLAYVRSLRFEGNRSYAKLKLGGVAGTKARLWPFLPGVLDVEQIERDVAELGNFYHNEGYLDAQVSRRLEFSPERKRVDVTFIIEEGPRYRIRQVEINGASVYTPDEIRRQLKLQPGSFFNALALRRDQEKLRTMYGEIGYINVEVTAKSRFATPAQTQPGARPAEVDLVYNVTEDAQFHLGRIDIRGNEVTKQNVIRRQLQFFPGQLYNTVAVDESKNRLMETQLFGKVDITPFGDEPGMRNSLVSIEEGKTGQFIIGVGVSSNAGLLGNVTYTERNFDIFAWPSSWEQVKRARAFRGAGQTFTISAEPGTEFSRFRLDWREPYLMDQPYSLGLGAFMFTSQRESYDETRFGLTQSLGHRFANRWYGELATRQEIVNIGKLDDNAPQDVRDVRGDNALLGIKGSLVRDNTDSRWLPSKGDRLSLSYEQVTGDFNFGRATADYHAYQTLYLDPLDRKHILAERAAVGGIIGDAPVFERFYGGGLGSIRGFKYRGISPRQGADDDPVGGDFSLFLGTEYTFPLIGEVLRGVIFLDTGTVERELEIKDYRASAGAGIRLHLPFFGPVPMSLDFGLPIRKADQDDTQLVSFSIGWVF